MSGPPIYEPKRGHFAFALRVVAAVSPLEYQRLAAENRRIQKEANALLEALRNAHVSYQSKADKFSPRTDEEKKMVAQRQALKESLQRLPSFYYRDVSLELEFYPSIWVIDDRIREECSQVMNKVLGLLSKYEETP